MEIGAGPSAHQIFSARKPRTLGPIVGRRVGQEIGLVFPDHPTSRIKMLHLDRTDAPAASEYAMVYLMFELSKAK